MGRVNFRTADDRVGSLEARPRSKLLLLRPGVAHTVTFARGYLHQCPQHWRYFHALEAIRRAGKGAPGPSGPTEVVSNNRKRPTDSPPHERDKKRGLLEPDSSLAPL